MVASWLGKFEAKSNGSFPQKCAKCDFPSDGDFQANNGIATADWWPADWESLSKIQWFVSLKNVQNAIFRPMVIFRLTMVLQRRYGGQLIGKVWAKSNGSFPQKCAKCDSTFDRHFQAGDSIATTIWWPADWESLSKIQLVRFLKNVENAIQHSIVIFKLAIVLQRRYGSQLIGKVWTKSNGSFPQKCAKCDFPSDGDFQANSSIATADWWPADWESLSKIQWLVSSKMCKMRFQHSIVIFKLAAAEQRQIGGQLIAKVWAKSNGSFPQKTCKTRFNIRWWFSSWQQQSNAKLVASWLPKFEQNPMVRFLKNVQNAIFRPIVIFRLTVVLATADWWPADWESLSKIQWFVSSKMCKMRFSVRWVIFRLTMVLQRRYGGQLIGKVWAKSNGSFPQKCAKCDFPSDGDFQANNGMATTIWWPADWESLSKIQWFVSSKMGKMRLSVRWWFSG